METLRILEESSVEVLRTLWRRGLWRSEDFCGGGMSDMSRRKGIQEVPLYLECIGGAGWAKSEDRKWLSRNPNPQRWKWLNFTQKQSPAPVPSCSRSITYCPSSFLYQTLPVSGPCCSSSFTSCFRSFQLQHPSFLRPYFSGFWPVASGPSQPSLANTPPPPPPDATAGNSFVVKPAVAYLIERVS